MHDFILSAVEREAHITNGEEFSPVPQPKIVTFSTDRSSVFCPWCSEIVELFNAVESAAAFNTDLQDIRFLLNTGEIHALREDAATIAICQRSVEICFEKRRTRLLDSYFERELNRAVEGDKA